MKTFSRMFVGILTFGCFVDTIMAQTTWVGKTVVPKRNGIKLYKTDVAGEKTEVGVLDTFAYRVVEDKDGRLRVPSGRGVLGWFDKNDAVLLDEAIPYLTGEIKKDPQNARLHQLLAGARTSKGDFDGAIKDLDRALELAPNDASCYGNRGAAWHYKKVYDKAIDDYSTAIRLEGKPSDLNNLAWLLATCPDEDYRDPRLAVKYALQALAADEKHAGVMDTLAAAYAANGEFDEAVRWAERTLEDPRYQNDKGARARLALYREKKTYLEK